MTSASCNVGRGKNGSGDVIGSPGQRHCPGPAWYGQWLTFFPFSVKKMINGLDSSIYIKWQNSIRKGYANAMKSVNFNYSRQCLRFLLEVGMSQLCLKA